MKPFRNHSINIKILIISLIVFVLAIAAHAFADSRSDFYENAFYDIYYQTSEGTTDYIQHVKILEIKTIENIKFLVIRGSELGRAETQGFIRFDAVRAILPTGYLTPSHIAHDYNNK